MISSCSPRSGVTPTSSARDLNPPIITFVGRLHASQKGHDTFLEALGLIETAGETSYSAWLVGGSLAEARHTAEAIAGDAALAAMHRSGRLVLWGRVSAEALPEIYSRSTVVAMPSRRETFGLVAVQAMLCRTPVAAAAVGGLLDTVIPKVTGAHFEAEDSYALAFILQGLLRNRFLADWLGRRAERWAKENFGRTSRAGGFGRILQAQVGTPPGPHPLETPSDFWAAEDEEEVRAAVGAMAEIERLPSNRHPVFRIAHDGVPAFAKLFLGRPDFDGSVYRMPAELVPALNDARMTRSAVAGRSPAALGSVETRGRVMIHPWCEPAGDTPRDEALDLANLFAMGGPGPSAVAVAACAEALRTLSQTQDWRALDAFDLVAARMNAPLTGSETVFVRCHPEAEILRLTLHCEVGAWPLRPAVRKAMWDILVALGNSVGSTPREPRLQHGDLTARHVMRRDGQLVLVDLEDARFAYGDLDRGRFAFETFLAGGGRRIADVVATIGPASPRGEAEVDAAALWFACEAFHRALGKASWGGSGSIEDAIAACEEVVLPWLKRR